MSSWLLISLVLLLINAIALAMLVANYFSLKRKFARSASTSSTSPLVVAAEGVLAENASMESTPATREAVSTDGVSVDPEAAALFSKLGETSSHIRDVHQQFADEEASGAASPTSSSLLDDVCKQVETRRHDPSSRALADLVRALYLEGTSFQFAALEDLNEADRSRACALVAAKLNGEYPMDDWELAYERTRIVLE